jgi:hypothetical protein
MDLITIISNLHETPTNHAHKSKTKQLFIFTEIKPTGMSLNMHKLKSWVLQLFATQIHVADWSKTMFPVRSHFE